MKGAAQYARYRFLLCYSDRWSSFTGVDDVGEHSTVALAHLDPDRHGAVLRDLIHQRPERRPSPRPRSRLRVSDAIDSGCESSVRSDGDDHIRQIDGHLWLVIAAVAWV